MGGSTVYKLYLRLSLLHYSIKKLINLQIEFNVFSTNIIIII